MHFVPYFVCESNGGCICSYGHSVSISVIVMAVITWCSLLALTLTSLEVAELVAIAVSGGSH